MLHMDASNSIWIGNVICTLCTMKMPLSLRGAIVALHRVNNGEIASRGLEAVERQGKAIQIIEIKDPYYFPI